MVLRDETFLLDSAAHDKFRLHAVGADFRHRKVVGIALSGGAVAVHMERHSLIQDVRLVLLHALQQPGQLRVITVERYIEHVPVGDEAERVYRIGLPLRKERESHCRQP